MKSVFLFSSKFRFFLTEIPPVLLLIVSIHFNSRVDTLMRLYPLIITLSVLIIFIAIYFFRAVVIKYDQVRSVGPFSERDSAVIAKDKSLVLTILPKKKLKIELFGDSGDLADTYKWLKGDEKNSINLFRAKANGGAKAVKRIMRFFEIPEDAANALLQEDGLKKDLDALTVRSDTKNECKTVSIFFKKTI